MSKKPNNQNKVATIDNIASSLPTDNNQEQGKANIVPNNVGKKSQKKVGQHPKGQQQNKMPQNSNVGGTTAKKGISPQKQRKIITACFVAVVLIAVIIGLSVGLSGAVMPSVKSAFKQIDKNNNYSYTVYISRPTTSRIVFINNAGSLRYIDTGVNKFVLDYRLDVEDVGIYTEINNVWVYEETLRGDEGTSLGADNKTLLAFNLATEAFEDNFTYDDKDNRYYLNEESQHKVFAGSQNGKCSIYKKGGKIYIDCYYGLDDNNKERFVITKVGGVSVKIPELTDMGL